jgi:DNA-binding CsgD family transcriptional regulator
VSAILCPQGHRHVLPLLKADCWLAEGVVREVPVTRQEFRVAQALLFNGATNAAIGKKLFLSEDTVKSHMKKLLARTGAATRTELMAAVFRGHLRLIPVDVAAGLFWNAEENTVMSSVSALQAATMDREARASVALDGETHVVGTGYVPVEV